ncbi:MAG: M3 family oligoendopeptidase [Anaerolineae bacterium]|nr:M3 family oligoendopeptidase [Anaerolineae bacterium]
MATLAPLPDTTKEFINWSWEQIAPYFAELAARPLTATTVNQWLKDWSNLSELMQECSNRLEVAVSQDTADKEVETRFFNFLDNIQPKWTTAEQQLKEKLLASGLEPQGFEIPLRNMRSEAALFREVNLPLLVELTKLGTEYDGIKGAQTVNWDGKEITVMQLRPYSSNPDRNLREKAWRAAVDRNVADRQAINALWQKVLPIRWQVAKNAGLKDFREYIWRSYLRFDYTPEDCLRFHDAIEQTVVPAVKRLAERKRAALNIESIRPWDMNSSDMSFGANVDPKARPPLKPYQTATELEQKAAAIFSQVDPELGEEFEMMRRSNLLDLDNRKGKAPGGYCTSFPRERRPFIFMNAVGIHDDVQTLLHEGGHAFHVFETAHLPYVQQTNYTMEIAEVASMAMELLAQPYLASDGGYYSKEDAARATAEHLEGMLLFWPYMAVVDAFQHWAHTSGELALDPANLDAKWGELYDRFMNWQDWSGLDDAKVTGWQRKLHIFRVPFYYVEYGIAQLGAAQVWRNSLRDQAAATAAYRKALALGGTRPLPELYAAAGIKLAFDSETLGQAVELIEETLHKLDA